MNPFIRLVRTPYEEPYHLCLDLTASNGSQLATLEFYLNPEDLLTLAVGFSGFPKDFNGGEFVWDLGSEDPQERSAYYLRLRVFTTDRLGHCALEIRLNNNQGPPHQAVAEFSIPAVPADLDRFAELLREFSELTHTTLVWTATGGELS